MRAFMSEHPTIAIDFDGVIKSGNDYMNMNTPPTFAAVEVIQELKAMGCSLILWTSRQGEALSQACKYLEKYGILNCFVAINEPAPQDRHFEHGRKVFANYYVDDMNVEEFKGFINLLDTVTSDIFEYKNSLR